jgi:hypothetical protein
MTIAMAFQQLVRREASISHLTDDPKECRDRMRCWAKQWRRYAGQKDSFHLEELALGNALGWRDRATWALED